MLRSPVGLRRFRPETTRRSSSSQAGIVNFLHSSERMIASLKTLFAARLDTPHERMQTCAKQRERSDTYNGQMLQD